MAMLAFPENHAIQHHGCWAISYLLHDPPMIQPVFAHRGVIALLRALARFRSDPELQDAALRSLAHVTKRVGLEVMERHDPSGAICVVCVQAILAHPKEENVLHSGTKLLDVLAPHAGAVLRALRGLNAVVPTVTWHENTDTAFCWPADFEAPTSTKHAGPRGKYATNADRLAMEDDIFGWDPTSYCSSLLDEYGYSLETDGRGTAEQIAALVQGLWEADARNDVRVIMTVLGTLAWHAQEFASAINDHPEFREVAARCLQLEDVAMRRTALRAIGNIARWVDLSGDEGVTEVKELVLKCAAHHDPVLRREALLALAEMQVDAPEAKAAARTCLLDDDIATRQAAAQYLRQVLPKLLGEELLEKEWVAEVSAHLAFGGFPIHAGTASTHTTAGAEGAMSLWRLPGLLLLAEMAATDLNVVQEFHRCFVHRALRAILREPATPHV